MLLSGRNLSCPYSDLIGGFIDLVINDHQEKASKVVDPKARFELVNLPLLRREKIGIISPKKPCLSRTVIRQ